MLDTQQVNDNYYNGGQGITEVMLREGVEKAFCVPGESYLPLMDAIYDRPEIQLISTRHEGGAAFMAEGYAKSSGKVGVCMATRGVGSTNLAVGIHTAHQDSTPLVCFIGQLSSEVREREGFQEIKLDEFYGHITKWAIEISDTKRIPELVHRAFRVAQSGRPGPVLVGLPIDMLHNQVPMEFQNSMISSPPAPSRTELTAANDLLNSAEKPIIIAGGGVNLSGAQDDLVELSELTNLPVMTSFRRHDAFPNNHNNYIGHIGLNADSRLQEIIKSADVILAIGMKFSQIFTQEYTLIEKHSKIIHIDTDYQSIGKVYNTEIGIVSDAKLAIRELISLNKHNSPSKKRSEYCNEAKEIYNEVSLPSQKYREDYVDLEGMIYDLQNSLDDTDIITNCAGNYTSWIHKFYQFNKAKTYLGPTSGAMGYSLPAALGAKLAHPNRKVVSIAGDGGFMMSVQEIATSVQYDIPVIIIVVNNNMYGTIRMHQEKNFPKREIGTNLINPNFTELAKSFGIEAFFAQNNLEFRDCISKAIDSRNTVLIEVSADPEVISVNKTISEIQRKK